MFHDDPPSQKMQASSKPVAAPSLALPPGSPAQAARKAPPRPAESPRAPRHPSTSSKGDVLVQSNIGSSRLAPPKPAPPPPKIIVPTGPPVYMHALRSQASDSSASSSGVQMRHTSSASRVSRPTSRSSRPISTQYESLFWPSIVSPQNKVHFQWRTIVLHKAPGNRIGISVQGGADNFDSKGDPLPLRICSVR